MPLKTIYQKRRMIPRTQKRNKVVQMKIGLMTVTELKIPDAQKYLFFEII